MACRRGGALVPLFWLLAAALASCSQCHFGCTFLTSTGRTRPTDPSRRRGPLAGVDSGRWAADASARIALQARGGDIDDDNEAVEVGGFAGFIVGLALLPHIVYSLNVAFGVAASGAALSFGPFGITVISFITTVGVTCWSLGSFVQRGMGLPAGPLGLLGLAEGLSYLGTLGVVVAVLSFATRSGLGAPDTSATSASSAPAISTKAPAAKTTPSKDLFDDDVFPSPPIKVESKAPTAKAPEAKLPEYKAPKPEPKPDPPKPKPEPPKPAPEAAKPAAKPAPKPEPPKPAEPEESGPSFSDLFD